MLPELAWTLRKGDVVVATNPDTMAQYTTVVERVIGIGQPYETYVLSGYDQITAIKRQHDAPTILLRLGGILCSFNPAFVELALDVVPIMCTVCGRIVKVNLPLRLIEKLKKEVTIYDFENESKLVTAMVLQCRCGFHAESY